MSAFPQGPEQDRLSAPATTVKYGTGTTSQKNKARKGKEGIHIGKDIKWSLFANDMMVY